jgi:uncharacterized protein
MTIPRIQDMRMKKNQLHLIILPTEQCNFRCTYCYEDFKIKGMNQDMASRVKLLISDQVPHLNKLEIAWFGGEPLLKPEIILEIAEHAFLACKTQSTCSLDGNITTNGLKLTKELTRKLSQFNHKFFHITLDGTEEVHNKTRKLSNGSGTFSKIYANLLTLRDSELDFKILLRIHLFEQNLLGMNELFILLEKDFSEDPRFEVYIAPIENYGGEGVKSLGILRKNTMPELARLSGFENTKWHKKSTPQNYVCYASQTRSFAIRPNGRIVKCTHSLDAPNNQIGILNERGKLELNIPMASKWLHGWQSENLADLACPMQNLDKSTITEHRILVSDIKRKR